MKGLSKDRYNETFAGEDDILSAYCILRLAAGYGAFEQVANQLLSCRHM